MDYVEFRRELIMERENIRLRRLIATGWAMMAVVVIVSAFVLYNMA